jgi:hypothetical protein
MAEQAYEQFEEYEVPAGGIADFIVPDEEIEAMDRADAERSFGDSGIANFKDVAARMAGYGRYGDDTVAHVQTGEIVIPAALIADNPTLKESIFDDLRARGIDDPERYVVGSPENSINPETGLPEFFLKKIFKGVKKAFKKVGKFLKKAATVVLPIALSFTPLGPVFGSALGSGIASLINGGNLKDAFKAAAIAGATGGLIKGVGSAMTGGSFTGGIMDAISAPGARLSQTASGLQSTLTGGGLTGSGNLFTGYAPPTAGAPTPPVGPSAPQPGQAGLPPVSDAVPVFDPASDVAAQNLANTQQVSAALDAQLQPLAGAGSAPGGAATTFTPGAGSPSGVSRVISMRPGETVQQALARSGGGPSTIRSTITSSQPFTTAPAGAGAPDVGSISFPTATSGAGASGVSQAMPGAPTPDVSQAVTAPPVPGIPPAAVSNAGAGTRNALQRSMDYLVRGGQTPDQIIAAQRLAEKGAIEESLAKYGYASLDAAPAEIRTAVIEAGKAAAAKAGPGFFTKYGPLAALGTAGLYAGGFFETPEVEQPDLIPSITGMDILAQNQEKYFGPGGRYTPPSGFEAGGEVFPRRNGGIMPYEGTPDEDSVRALLMPGEFVMTKDAVRGLGNGSMDRGIKNMYTVMRDLERRGRVA